MSAFFVAKETIDAVVAFMIRTTGPISVDRASAMGRKFWLYNAMALEQRYGDPIEEKAGEIEVYRWNPCDHALPVLLKSLHCFLYQCAEGNVPELEFYQRLSQHSEHYRHLKDTPEYDEAPWGLCELG